MENKKLKEFLRVSSSVYGSGAGYGDGSGYGSGYGSGDGSGYGDGSGVESINNNTVHMIDSIMTVITHIKNNVAKGFILCSDLSLSPCYVAKQDNLFAHGETVKEAIQALNVKIFDNMSTDERIDSFIGNFDWDIKYPAMEFFDWHNKLTGSCQLGRETFAKDHEIDLLNDQFTVKEFIELTKDSFEGQIIRQLETAYKNELKHSGKA